MSLPVDMVQRKIHIRPGKIADVPEINPVQIGAGEADRPVFCDQG